MGLKSAVREVMCLADKEDCQKPMMLMLPSLVVVADHYRLLMIADADEERDVERVPMKTMVVCRLPGWIGSCFHIC
jgi:hypothetical protein